MENVVSSSHASKSTISAKGICAAQGISACGIAGGFRRKLGKLDLALVVADKLSVAAGVFTKNIFCAAPVTVSREHVRSGYARAIILNSANANAATGEPGLRVARETAEIVAEELGCKPEDVLVASTGVIGMQLDIEKFVTAVPKAVAALSATGGGDAAHAIMTTDTVPKEYAESFEYDGIVYWLGGMAKGSGMIMPDMATMLAVLTTDAPISVEAARVALKAAVDTSFNKVTVDSDTSTNDSCFLLATGAAGGEKIEVGSEAYALFLSTLTSVCESLAKQIARDGEGATKLVEVTVVGAASATDADLCARSIANSPLVKTAIAGHDANWGRIAMAAGKSGARFEQETVAIDIMGIPVCRDGLTVPFDEEEALKRFEEPEIDIYVDLGSGTFSTRIWTCDFTHEYISINADYRS